jgi:colanic acid/amylovoran biosynthesis glycosyltransferase
MTRVAYLCSQYPYVSHTFVLREVQAVRDAGVEVHTFSVRGSSEADALSLADRQALATTTAILPAGAGTLARAAWTALRHPGALADTLRWALARAVPGMRGPIWQLFYTVEAVILFGHLRRLGIRHVHAHFANVGADVARLVAHFGTLATGERWTWSFTMHGNTEFNDVSRFGLASKTEDADAVLCISDFCRSQLQARVPIEVWDRLHVVRCGIETDRFSPEPGAANGGPLHLINVGRLCRDKAQTILIEAMGDLVRRGVDVQLTLIGGGDERADLEARARREGVADRVHLTGPMGQDEIVAWYRKADLFVLSSIAEGVPVVLMEAMACGLPVVATRIAGIPELVEEGVSGLLVTPGRHDLLADAVAELADDPERRRAMGEAGRAKVRADFDAAANGRTVAEHLRRVAG